MVKTREEIDAEKASQPRPDLIPGRARLAIGAVMAYGYSKHGAATYTVAGTEQAKPEVHVASAERHLAKCQGADIGALDESGQLHLAHAASQLTIALECLLRAQEAEAPFAGHIDHAGLAVLENSAPVTAEARKYEREDCECRREASEDSEEYEDSEECEESEEWCTLHACTIADGIVVVDVCGLHAIVNGGEFIRPGIEPSNGPEQWVMAKIAVSTPYPEIAHGATYLTVEDGRLVECAKIGARCGNTGACYLVTE